MNVDKEQSVQNDIENDDYEALFSTDKKGPVKRGRKAAELFQFEQDSLRKITMLKEQAKNVNLNPLSRRLFRNKASA
jgi:hypothetical protein